MYIILLAAKFVLPMSKDMHEAEEYFDEVNDICKLRSINFNLWFVYFPDLF